MKLRAAVVAFGCLGFILYLSLSPWHFTAQASVPWLRWDFAATTRRALLDAILNVGFYIPFGAALSWLIGQRRAAIPVATAAGAALSFGVEFAQMYVPHRDPSYIDLCTNTLGSLIGATLAWTWIARGVPHWLTGRWRAWTLSPSGALLAALWIGSQTFPFMPVFRLDRATEAMHRILAPAFVPSELVLGFVALFVLSQVVEGRGWQIVALGALPAQLFIVGRMPSPGEILAATAGVVVGRAVRGRLPPRVMAGFMLTWLLWEELRPFHFGPPQPFNWLPFAGLMTGAPDGYGATILLKLFLYGAVVWAMRTARASWAMAIAAPALLLTVGESAQRFLPGRMPETSDFVLLIAAALFLGAAERAARSQREQVALRVEARAT